MKETIELTTSDGRSTGPVPIDVFKKAVEVVRGKKTEAPADFALEPSDGNIPDRVIEELREAYELAKDRAQSYSDAAKAQAEKYKLKPGALKKYIAALANDSIAKLDAEMTDLEKLIG